MSRSGSCVQDPPGPLRTERCPDGRRKLLRPLRVELDGRRIAVPRGFVTDYSSIPSFGRFVVRWSRVDVAGVVHDWLYARRRLPRSEADDLWRLAARSGECRANRLQAWVCWKALRWFGGFAWRKHANSRLEAGKRCLCAGSAAAGVGRPLKVLREQCGLDVNRVAARMGVRPAVVESLEAGSCPDLSPGLVCCYVSAIGAMLHCDGPTDGRKRSTDGTPSGQT